MSDARSFRPDIQGLRALAVGLVILAHAGLRTAAGGYVGVDVFFVISGFLIVGLLVREAGRTRRISIVDFYARRARRVIPAATAVLVVTAVASAYVLPYVRSLEVLKDSVWAAFFGANIRFALVETDYFAEGEPPSPVQHYWSLSVEEQFYVVIPVLLLVVAVALRRWGNALPDRVNRQLRRAVVAVLGAVSLASLAYSVWVTAANPTAAYFSTPARAWELGVGGLLGALLWGRRPELRRWLAELAGVAGLALVAVATLTYSAATPMPGTAALVPVAGAGLLLFAGATTTGPATYWFRLFSLRPIRVLGDWSYSLYLWHFPVLLLAQAHWEEPRLSRPHLAVALLLILGLSAASYHLVEEPFRRGVRWRPRVRAIGLYPVSLALVIAAAAGSQAWVDHQIAELESNPAIAAGDYDRSDLSKDPAVALVQASVLAAREDRPVPGGLEPDLGHLRESVAPLGECDYRTGTTRLCPFGDADAERSIVVVGDSHARAWGPAVSAIGERHGYAVYQLVYSGCPANAVTRPDPEGGGQWTECERFKEWALARVAELRPELVLVANNAYRGRHMADGRQERGLADHLRRLDEAGGRVVMLGNVPKLERSPGVCLSTRDKDLGDCLFEPLRRHVKDQRRFAAVAESVGVDFVDAQRWFCHDGVCPPVIGRLVPLRDRDHISVEYATRLADPLARALGID
ncbi:acyltransferase family protein [Nocardioides sp. SYSU DS0651]|uniref:acyltransferase family protein n=1 Tax=Nocardioides sp. SYSU DS0651 TaxID=3415955 RepID=UPI003F4C7DAD